MPATFVAHIVTPLKKKKNRYSKQRALTLFQSRSSRDQRKRLIPQVFCSWTGTSHRTMMGEPVFDFISVQSFVLSWMTYNLVAMTWYSKPLFGDLCGRLSFGRKQPPKPDSRAITATTLGSAMALLFFSFMLKTAGCETAMEGALWGLAFGLFFDTGLNASHCFFEDRPFALFLIHRGCHAVGLSVVGAILGLLCGEMEK